MPTHRRGIGIFDDYLLLILLFVAIFFGGGLFGLGHGQQYGGIFGRDNELIFFIILLLLFSGGLPFGRLEE